jgi:hypothetical protein
METSRLEWVFMSIMWWSVAAAVALGVIRAEVVVAVVCLRMLAALSWQFRTQPQQSLSALAEPGGWITEQVPEEGILLLDRLPLLVVAGADIGQELQRQVEVVVEQPATPVAPEPGPRALLAKVMPAEMDLVI